MAVYLKGHVGTAPERQRSTLEVAHRGIEIHGLHRAQIGRRRHRQLVPRGVGVSQAGHHIERHLAAAGQPALAVDHAGELAQGHAMHHRQRQAPYPRRVARVEERPVDIHAVGVGAVKHHKTDAPARGLAHQLPHGDIICIVAHAHILYVAHHHIHRVHRRGRHPLAAAVVERHHRQAGGGIGAGGHSLAGVGRAAEPVLRREEHPHIDTVGDERVERMTAVGQHAGMVGKQRHTLAGQQRAIHIGALRAYTHTRPGSRRSGSQTTHGDKR